MIVFSIVALILLLCFSAFFSSAESALFSLDPVQVHRIRAKHPQAGARIERALSMPTRLLSMILIGNTLINVAAASLGYATLERLLPARGIVVAIPGMTVLLLVFGEISPKRLALHVPEQLSILCSRPIAFFMRAMAPATYALGWIASLLKRWLTPTPAFTEAEFRTAMDESEERGVIDPEERSIVEGIIRIEGLTAGDVMTPRIDLVAIDETDSLSEIADIARKSRFRILPVYRETQDHIQGFLDVPRFLIAGGGDLDAAVLPPVFVPHATPLNKLMVMFQTRRRRAACVVDEFGGTAGIVTEGDVMEEILEGTRPAPSGRVGIEPAGDARWHVGGDMSLEEINAELGFHLAAENATRIGGWVSAHLKRVPRRGDVVSAQGCRVVVLGVRQRRVTHVMLQRQHRGDQS